MWNKMKSASYGTITCLQKSKHAAKSFIPGTSQGTPTSSDVTGQGRVDLFKDYVDITSTHFRKKPYKRNIPHSTITESFYCPAGPPFTSLKNHKHFILYNNKRKMGTTAKIDTYYDAVLKYTKLAGELIKEKVSVKNKAVETKASEIDFVTETDQEVETLLIDHLSKEFPDHQFIGEESVANGGQCNLTDAPTWIIDPIDGTMNFVHGFPHSCVSIALFVNQIPEIGIIFNPMLGQLFSAKRGQGAFFNGKKIHVSEKTSLGEALVMMEFGTHRDEKKMKVVAANQELLMNQVHGLRALGSAALDMAMVAMGAADAYFEFGIHIWDIAAGELLVTEAGGVIMDPSGGPIDRLSRRVLVASSQALAEQLAQKVVQFHPTPRD